MSAGDGDGGDGGGFGAEDAGAEGDGLPLVLGEEGDLFWVQPPSGPMAMAVFRSTSYPSSLAGDPGSR